MKVLVQKMSIIIKILRAKAPKNGIVLKNCPGSGAVDQAFRFNMSFDFDMY